MKKNLFFSKASKAYKEKMSDKPLLNRLFSGGFYSLVGNIFPRIFVILSLMFVSRLLGEEQYGEFSLLRSTIDNLTIFALFGLGNTATKYIAQYKDGDEHMMRKTYLVTTLFSFFLTFVLILIIAFASPLVAEKMDAPQLEPYLVFCIGALFFASINGLQRGVINGLEEFKALAKNTIIGILVQSIGLLVLTYFYGIYGGIAALTIGWLIQYVLNFRVIRRKLKTDWIMDYLKELRAKDFKILYSFSLPNALAALAASAAMLYSKYWIKGDTGSFVDNGLIDVGEQWMFILFIIPAAVGQVALPILSNALYSGKKGAKKDYWKLLLTNMLLGSGALVVAALILSPFAGFILSFYANGAYTQTTVFVLFLFTAVFRSVCTIAGQAILSRGITWLSLVFNMIWATLFLSLLYLPFFEAEGAYRYSYAYFTSYAIYMCIQLVFLLSLYMKERKFM